MSSLRMSTDRLEKMIQGILTNKLIKSENKKLNNI